MEAKLIQHLECVPCDSVKIEFSVNNFCDIFVIAVSKELPDEEDIPAGFFSDSQ